MPLVGQSLHLLCASGILNSCIGEFVVVVLLQPIMVVDLVMEPFFLVGNDLHAAGMVTGVLATSQMDQTVVILLVIDVILANIVHPFIGNARARSTDVVPLHGNNALIAGLLGCECGTVMLLSMCMIILVSLTEPGGVGRTVAFKSLLAVHMRLVIESLGRITLAPHSVLLGGSPQHRDLLDPVVVTSIVRLVFGRRKDIKVVL